MQSTYVPIEFRGTVVKTLRGRRKLVPTYCVLLTDNTFIMGVYH